MQKQSKINNPVSLLKLKYVKEKEAEEIAAQVKMGCF